MGNDMLSTGEIEAVFHRRYPNLEPGWLTKTLKELNKSAGWLRQRYSGNGLLSIPWLGGKPQQPEWTVKVQPPDCKPNRD